MKRFDLAILVAAVAIVAGGAGFAIGHATSPQTTASKGSGSSGNSYGNQGLRMGGMGEGGMRMRGFGTRGTVTAVSGNTITLKDDSGANHTINVTSSTSYLDGSNRSSSSLSAVTSGTTILASGQTGSDGTINATRIIVNPPNFGGGQGSAPSSDSSGTSPSN